MSQGHSDDLDAIREEIDRIDDAIADLVLERLELAADVAACKEDADRSLVDEEREAAVEARYARAFEGAGLDGDRGETLARTLIETALATELALEDDDPGEA